MRQEPPISNIDIYQIFRKVPDVSDDEAKQTADSVARVDQVATKADIRELRADLIALEDRLKARLEAKMLKLALWAVAFNVTLTVSLTVGLTVGLIKLL